MSKTVNLQPYLDYFEVLQDYIEKGYLEVYPEKGEAYVAEAVLNVLSNTDAFPQEKDLAMEGARRLRDYTTTLRHIRAYAGWCSQEGKEYLKKPFALHVVKDMQPYDPLCTILLSVRRCWWNLWRPTDNIDVIPMTDKISGNDGVLSRNS